MAKRPSSRDETQQLKELAHTIVVSQGNQFIKELLRKNNIKIGTNKKDFEANLNAAIDEGLLTQGDFDEWLEDVEGWGNQHVYFHQPLRHSRAQILRLVEGSPSKHLLNIGRSHAFPAELTLTSIDVTASSVSLSWHRGTTSADRVEERDKDPEWIDGDLYEFRAYRQRDSRAVVRFEWTFDRPYSAVFMQLPNEGQLHDDTLTLVYAELRAAGLAARAPQRIPLSNAAKVLGSDPAEASAKSQVMHTHGGYVALVATIEDGGIEKVAAVRETRQGVDARLFQSADGRYNFSKHHHDALGKDIKLEIFGAQSRARIWVKCKRDDVYYVTDRLWQHNQ